MDVEVINLDETLEITVPNFSMTPEIISLDMTPSPRVVEKRHVILKRDFKQTQASPSSDSNDESKPVFKVLFRDDSVSRYGYSIDS